MDVTIEQQIIAACLQDHRLIRFASERITGDQFYDVRYGAAWDLMVQARADRAPLNQTTFHLAVVQAGINGIGPADAWAWSDYVSSTSEVTVSRLAGGIHEAYLNRGWLEATQRHRPGVGPVGEGLSKLITDLSQLREGAGKKAGIGGMSLRELLDIEDDYDWLVEGLMERGDRAMITGGEGAGKTTFIRQMGVMLAAGFHPFTLERIPPLRVLVLDTENGYKQWKRAVKDLTASILHAGPPIDPRDNMDIICRERLDLKRQDHLALIHEKIDDFCPDILFIGPLYKLTAEAITTDDEAAPVLAALDGIRARDIALVIEAHAGKSHSPEGGRNLAPRGSSALLGWPEFGIGLRLVQEKCDGVNRVVELTRWRGDRDVRSWPLEVTSSGPLLWNWEGDGDADPGLSRRRQAFYRNR